MTSDSHDQCAPRAMVGYTVGVLKALGPTRYFGRAGASITQAALNGRPGSGLWVSDPAKPSRSALRRDAGLRRIIAWCSTARATCKGTVSCGENDLCQRFTFRPRATVTGRQNVVALLAEDRRRFTSRPPPQTAIASLNASTTASSSARSPSASIRSGSPRNSALPQSSALARPCAASTTVGASG